MNQTVTWSPVSRDSTIESSSQLLPILYGSDMMSMVDGTTSAPSETVMVDSKTVPNQIGYSFSESRNDPTSGEPCKHKVRHSDALSTAEE